MARDDVPYFPGNKKVCQKEACLIETSGKMIRIYSETEVPVKPDPMARKLSAYYRALRRHLYCSKQDKDQFLHEVKEAVWEFRGEHSDCDFSAVVQAIGEPRKWAHDIMTNRLDPSVVQAYKQRRKRICKLFVAGSLALVLALGCVSIYLYEMKSKVVFSKETTIIIEKDIKP